MSGGERAARNGVRPVWAAGVAHPESPRWLAQARQLAFVDVATGSLLRFAPASGARTRSQLAPELGFALPRADGALLFGHGTTVECIGSYGHVDGDGDGDGDRDGVAHTGTRRAAGESVRRPAPFAQLPGDPAELRLNDAGFDAAGGLWTGTMDRRGARPLGALYRVAPDGTVATIADDFIIPNGFAASRAGDVVYVADSPRRVVDAFELDGDCRVRTRRRLLGPAAFGAAYPDGMTVDAEGHLWVACYDGGCVRRFRPDGSLERELRLPVPRVTACAFGGESLATLFVTAGDGLYAVEPGVTGIAVPGTTAAATPAVSAPATASDDAAPAPAAAASPAPPPSPRTPADTRD